LTAVELSVAGCTGNEPPATGYHFTPFWSRTWCLDRCV